MSAGGSSFRRPGASSGFILIEAITTMTISAFLLVALASLSGLLIRSMQETDRISARMETENRVLAALSRDLRLVQRVRWGGPSSAYVFSGDTDGLTFAIPGGGSDAAPTMLVSLSTLVDGAGARLVRREAALPPGASVSGAVAFSPPLTIYDGAGRIQFSYFARLPEGDEALLDRWQDPREHPAAIRVAITGTSSNDAARAVRVPLMIDADAGCAALNDVSCNIAPPDPAAPPEAGGPAIDADDPLGWMRYAQ